MKRWHDSLIGSLLVFLFGGATFKVAGVCSGLFGLILKILAAFIGGRMVKPNE